MHRANRPSKSRVEVREETLQTQELTLEELELALKVVERANKHSLLDEPLKIPNELKHLQFLDWEVLSDLFLSLEEERSRSRLQ